MISIDVEYLYIVPAIRKYVAKKLLEQGLKQKDVAKIMGFTPAAINQYLKNKRASKVVFNKQEQEIINKYVSMLINQKITLQALVKRVITEFEESGSVCRIHKSIEHIDKNCAEMGFNENC